jgi:hypothetical protein
VHPDRVRQPERDPKHQQFRFEPNVILGHGFTAVTWL